MLPGIDEVVAQLIYTIQYYMALLLWNLARILLSMARFIQSVADGLVANIGDFVQYTVNALSAPVGMFLVLAIAALGMWYLLNNIVATSKWVEPSRLLTYGLATLVFFSTPVLVIDALESVRTSLTQGIEATILDDAIADMFNIDTGSGDDPLPDTIPDVNSDGIIGTFDLAAYFLSISNITEVFNGDFPADFAADYFSDHPTEIDLSNEDERNQAIEEGWAGINRLVFSFVATPTAISEHLLWLVLTIAAVLLYVGFPLAAMLSFFVYTDALFTAYVRQFIKLCIETFISVIIVSFVIGLVAAAAQAGVGLYIGTSFIGTIILIWRIKGALKLATAAFDMFGGGTFTGGATGKDLRQMATTAVATTAAAATGGAALAAAGAIAADNKLGEAAGLTEHTLTGQDKAKVEARTQQLLSLAGYAAGRIQPVRDTIETAHEGRTFLRAMRDGGPQAQMADALDYVRAGSTMSTFGSSPWLAMRTSPSLRQAFDNIGGSGRTPYYTEDGAPVGEAGNGTGEGQLAGVLQQLTAVLQSFQAGGNGNGANGPAAAGQPPPPTAGDGPGNDGRFRPGPGGGDRPMPPPDSGAAGTTTESGQPDGRQPDGLPADTSQAPLDVNLVSSSPDLDGDLQEDRLEGQVILQPQTEPRTESLVQTVGHLQDPASLPGQDSHQALVVYTGKQNADTLQQAVSQHGPESVQAATQATVDVVNNYTQQGLNGAAILNAFQSGEGFTAVRNQIEGELPLTAGQLTAVADMVTMPRREVTPEELTQTIAATVGSGGSDREAAAALGVAAHFGPNTRAVRGTIDGAQEMGLTQAQTTQVLTGIQRGLMEEVRSTLAATSASPTTINNFIADASMLPTNGLQIAQTTAPRGQQED